MTRGLYQKKLRRRTSASYRRVREKSAFVQAYRVRQHQVAAMVDGRFYCLWCVRDVWHRSYKLFYSTNP
jgi:hypothetical protein